MELNNIKELIKIFENSELAFLEVDIDNSHIKMKKAQTVLENKVQVENVVKPKVLESVNQYKQIKSPVVGVFYLAPAPDQDAFVSVGQSVKKGDVIGLIEAMKVISEVKAVTSGIVREICVQNEQLVSFDDVLMQIEE